eukprot:Colp12_sorted_trinity150504_noHs@13102
MEGEEQPTREITQTDHINKKLAEAFMKSLPVMPSNVSVEEDNEPFEVETAVIVGEEQPTREITQTDHINKKLAEAFMKSLPIMPSDVSVEDDNEPFEVETAVIVETKTTVGK